MLLFPAIDLYDHKVVRLLKGDYQKMTVYSEDPVATARGIEADGAKDGTTPNFDVVAAICQETKLQVEIGGGIRSLEMIERYLNAGVARVILGTKAVTDEDFLRDAVGRWGERIAVGVDAKDGRVAVKGWVEVLDVDMFDFLWKLRSLGVKTAIVTDISKDGAMKGTNLPLYERLSRLDGIDITASGGVSTLEDIRALRDMGLYGAILGKAMYNGAIKLKDALDVARG